MAISLLLTTHYFIPRSVDLIIITEESNPNALPKVCGISLMLGKYEKSMKEPNPPLDPSAQLFMVTDQESLLRHGHNDSAWTPIPLDHSLWQADCKQYLGARNNPCENSNNFNLGKFYKMQPYRVPQIQAAGCNVVIWFDATIRIQNTGFMWYMMDRVSRGQNFLTYVHTWRRHGTIEKEMRASQIGKYDGREFQPDQQVDQQYKYYLDEGFREKWFKDEEWFEEMKGVAGNNDMYGMYVTCMVLFDLRQSITKKFLDCWWKENILRSTQDQLSFPYCAWKLKVPVHALPDAESPEGSFEKNPYFVKLGHGQ